MLPPTAVVRSAVEAVFWPGVASQPGASLLAMQFQLAQSEWWDAARLRGHQLVQLAAVLGHACEQVPWYRDNPCYREALAAGLDDEAFASLPLVTRAEAHDLAHHLHAGKWPAGHGRLVNSHTTGSTGTPLMVKSTELVSLFFSSLVLRDHLWWRRDFSAKAAVIRGRIEDTTAPCWLPGAGEALITGPMAMLNIRHPVSAQAAWLQRENPAYLCSPASNLYALARHCAANAVRVPGLREARVYGEVPAADLAETVHAAWGAKVSDIYSAEEMGTIALQCPLGGGYHVQAESVLLEVLDEHGRPCPPGAVGRVVLSTLNNFAMPLLRYAIGDYAEVGTACACGRGLPVLSRILGRRRNMLRLPAGDARWPRLGTRAWSEFPAIRQLQVAQLSLTRLEVRLVADPVLDEPARKALTAHLRETLEWPHAIDIVNRSSISRGHELKYEDFVNEMDTASPAVDTQGRQPR